LRDGKNIAFIKKLLYAMRLSFLMAFVVILIGEFKKFIFPLPNSKPPIFKDYLMSLEDSTLIEVSIIIGSAVLGVLWYNFKKMFSN
jgi:hypothetical protein